MLNAADNNASAEAGASVDGPGPAHAESRRRNEIASAGLACFERLGLAATRVEDVLAEAEISRSTFYRHFANLDELIKYLIARSTRTLVEQAVASGVEANENIANAVSEVIATMAGREKDTPIIQLLGAGELQRFSYLIIVDPDAMTQLFEPLADLLARGQREAVLRADMTVDAMLEWVSRCIASIRFRKPIDADTREGLKAYAQQFVMPALLSPSLAGPAAIDARLSRMERLLEAMADKPSISG